MYNLSFQILLIQLVSLLVLDILILPAGKPNLVKVLSLKVVPKSPISGMVSVSFVIYLLAMATFEIGYCNGFSLCRIIAYLAFLIVLLFVFLI